ncbi:/ atpG / F-ATPase gamma subunit /:132376 Forward [Candidatus Hepatoplasma crinochetorum]|uniref:ATP synthase gamma chain n=1 Tax=Candidatus Hepatoplasma crinochetorum TaxID=295596 RepID=A0A0G7ZNG1_9MOLU|nr:/ atpG / F-ATPase gamma subunit /:132376 Forward [Candidatus Hepatoplasma crinochetorum]
MAQLKKLKEQQNSIQSINKITKAMKLVSTAKAQKALKRLKSYKNYYLQIEKVVNDIAKDVTQKNDFKGTSFVIFTSDLGLVGGYNSNIIKIVRKEFNLKTDKIIIVGTKGNSFAKELLAQNFSKDKIISIHSDEFLFAKDLSNGVRILLSDYLEKNLKIVCIYTKYFSQISFEATNKILLPIEINKENNNISNQSELSAVTDYEPEKEILLNEILSIYLESLLFGYYLESVTSEYTSRRVAMENASKNGDDMLRKLIIAFHRERQAKITQEISEVIGGAEALK